MKDQHEKIKGYQDLTRCEIKLMNDCKVLAEDCAMLIARLRSDSTLDQRWINIGQTDLQKGFMALVRGIAQPSTF